MFKKLLVVLGLLVGAALPALAAPGTHYRDVVLVNNGGQMSPLGNASITVCQTGATGIPCSPTQPIYSDINLTVPLTNLHTDANGNFDFYILPGNDYVYTAVSANGSQSASYIFSALCPVGGTGCGGGGGGGITVGSTQVAFGAGGNTLIGDSTLFFDNTNKILSSNTFQTNTPNPGTGGFINLANTDLITWRNAANNGTNWIFSTGIASGHAPANLFATSGFGGIASTAFIAAGSYTSTATTGRIRFESSGNACWRSNADNSDLCLSKTSGDLLNYSGAGFNFTPNNVVISTTASGGAGEFIFAPGGQNIFQVDLLSIAPSNRITFFQSGGGFGTIVFEPSLMKIGGSSSGTALLGAAVNAGTPNRVNLPTATAAPGQCLTSDGGNPQQTTWSPCGSGAVSGQSTNSVGANTDGNSAHLNSVVCTPPITNGVYQFIYSITASVSAPPSCPLVGLVPDAAAGATVLYSDNNSVIYNPAAAVSLPTPATLGNTNFFTIFLNNGADSTVTPVTPWKISLNGAASATSAVAGSKQKCSLMVDQSIAQQWDLDCGPIGNSNVNLAVPGPIGNTTPSTGKFTTLSANLLNLFGATAGNSICTQGPLNGHAIFMTIVEECPATVVAYEFTKPGLGASGTRFGSAVAGVVTESYSGDSNHALVQTAKTSSITTATLCAATSGTACGQVGQYRISFNFWGSGTACSNVTAGKVDLNITYTDEDGNAHTTIGFPLWDQSKTAFGTSFFFNTAKTTESAEGSMVISTNGTIIQYATVYTACTTGTGTYNLRATVEPLQ